MTGDKKGTPTGKIDFAKAGENVIKNPTLEQLRLATNTVGETTVGSRGTAAPQNTA